MTTDTKRAEFSFVFDGVDLNDEQKHQIEDAIVDAVRKTLTSLQLSKDLKVTKSGDELTTEGLPTDPVTIMGGRATPE
ncbi:hypothetical protein ACWERI_37200 [Streptomyces collinus]